MNVADFLLERGEPERVAIVTEAGQHTYRELRAHIGGAARALRELGVAKGDRVGLLADNSLDWVAVYLGTLAVGAVAVPYYPTMIPQQLGVLARTTGCRVFAIQDKYRGRFADALPRGTTLLRHAAAEPVEGVAVDDRRDVATLMFTSGSTGVPRAVMVSHRNIIANTIDIIGSLDIDDRDRAMVVLPFHYCFGTSLLHTHLRAGGSLVLNNRFAYPQLVLDHMQRTECTGLAGVPSTYQILLRTSNLARRTLPSLRKLQQAGGKLPNVFIAELRAALPSARLYIMYGQTEATARLSCLPPELLDDRLGSIGKGMPGVDLRVLRADGTPVAVGEVGEIVARGDSIALGYWDDAEQTAQSFRDGALWTGDMARVDEDGFIFIVDRAKDFIKAAGHRVGAKEIEDHIVALTDVVEAAVIGVPDDVLGEAVKAYVVLRRDAATTPQDIVAHCKRVMPSYMVPREVMVMGALPKSSGGKVAKAELKTRSG